MSPARHARARHVEQQVEHAASAPRTDLVRVVARIAQLAHGLSGQVAVPADGARRALNLRRAPLSAAPCRVLKGARRQLTAAHRLRPVGEVAERAGQAVGLPQRVLIEARGAPLAHTALSAVLEAAELADGADAGVTPQSVSAPTRLLHCVAARAHLRPVTGV